MSIVNKFIGIPLGFLMFLCFKFSNSYGIAIILFTVLSKIILLPLSLVVQKNSIKMVKLQPEMKSIERAYAGDKDKIAELQIELYDKEKYSPILGLLPTLIQIPLILGLINVIYNPLQHLLRLSGEVINGFVGVAANFFAGVELGSTAQLKVLELTRSNPEAFAKVIDMGDDFKTSFDAILNFNPSFLGIDLSLTPSILSVNILWLIPILSGVSAFLMCLAQNKLNVLQREQGFWGKWGMTAFLVAFSTYFSFIVPTGVGLYWVAGNILSIPIMVVCNMIYNPNDYIDYSSRPKAVVLSKEEKHEIKEAKKKNKLREKADIKRFDNYEDKELVFYSESKGFYKYFSHYIEYILANSDIIVHYVTGDAQDPIFDKRQQNLEAYYVGDHALIPFMMKLETDIIVMTTPDLGNFHIKRSLVRKDIEYIYTDHGMTSLHLTLRENALDNFDTIFCNGPNQVEEILAMEKVYNLPAKTLVKTGYGLLDNMIAEYQKQIAEKINNTDAKQILIAPSWQVNNLLDYCLDDILTPLLNIKNYNIIIRPHPEYVKRFPEKMDNIVKKYENANVIIEDDFSSSASVFMSDLIITDWSSVAQDFSYTTKKPSLFVNTPMKITNPNYKKIPFEALEISLRDKVGVSVNIEDLPKIDRIISDLLAKQEEYNVKITKILEHNIYNPGRCGEVGGDYIIERLKK